MKTRVWAAVAALVVVAGCAGERTEPADSVSVSPSPVETTSPTETASPPPVPPAPSPEPPPAPQLDPEPAPQPQPAPEPEPAADCDPNYSGACVPIASDVDCEGGSGDGPEYVTGPVYVDGDDIYGLDRDGDGIGCDS